MLSPGNIPNTPVRQQKLLLCGIDKQEVVPFPEIDHAHREVPFIVPPGVCKLVVNDRRSLDAMIYPFSEKTDSFRIRFACSPLTPT